MLAWLLDPVARVYLMTTKLSIRQPSNELQRTLFSEIGAAPAG